MDRCSALIVGHSGNCAASSHSSLPVLRPSPVSLAVEIPSPEPLSSWAHLPEDRRLRPLRPHEAGVHPRRNRKFPCFGCPGRIESRSQVVPPQHPRNTKGPFAGRSPSRRSAASGWPVARARFAISLRFPSLPIAGSNCCDHTSCGPKQLILLERGHLRGCLNHGADRVPRQVEFDESAQFGSTIFDSLLND